jgi:hypothetical protein
VARMVGRHTPLTPSPVVWGYGAATLDQDIEARVAVLYIAESMPFVEAGLITDIAMTK